MVFRNQDLGAGCAHRYWVVTDVFARMTHCIYLNLPRVTSLVISVWVLASSFSLLHIQWALNIIGVTAVIFLRLTKYSKALYLVF